MHGGQSVRFVGHHGKIPHGIVGALYEVPQTYVPYLPSVDADKQGLSVHCRFRVGDVELRLPILRSELVVVDKPKSVRKATTIVMSDELAGLMDSLLGDLV